MERSESGLARGAGEATIEPPPAPPLAYSPPLARVHFNCPSCSAPVYFKARPDNRLDTYHGRELRCDCGRLLGCYARGPGGMVRLALASWPGMFDTPDLVA